MSINVPTYTILSYRVPSILKIGSSSACTSYRLRLFSIHKQKKKTGIFDFNIPKNQGLPKKRLQVEKFVIISVTMRNLYKILREKNYKITHMGPFLEK